MVQPLRQAHTACCLRQPSRPLPRTHSPRVNQSPETPHRASRVHRQSVAAAVHKAMTRRILVAKPDAVLEVVGEPAQVTADGTTVTRFKTAHAKIFERVSFPDGTVRWFQVVD